ncbi:uncharacterized [Tachysurus ichikawai]
MLFGHQIKAQEDTGYISDNRSIPCLAGLSVNSSPPSRSQQEVLREEMMALSGVKKKNLSGLFSEAVGAQELCNQQCMHAQRGYSPLKCIEQQQWCYLG